jgi:hypothetical protein
MLHYLIESGIIEADLERRIRAKRLPEDVKDRIENNRPLPAGRVITRDEAELIKQVYAVPPVGTMDNLTRQDMLGLADMYEGWAYDARMEADDPDPPQKVLSEEERKQFRERLRHLDPKPSKPQKPA